MTRIGNSPRGNTGSGLQQQQEQKPALQQKPAQKSAVQGDIFGQAGATPLLKQDLVAKTDQALKVDGVQGPQELNALSETESQHEVTAATPLLAQEPPKSLHDILTDHTVRVATFEDGQEQDEHESPIINVRKLPTHASPRSMMASATQIPERENTFTQAPTQESMDDDLPMVSFKK